MSKRPYGWVSRIFRRRAFAEDTVEAAVEAQLTFEAKHPVPFTPAQRRQAVLERAARIAQQSGAAVLPDFVPLVDKALEIANQKAPPEAT